MSLLFIIIKFKFIILTVYYYAFLFNLFSLLTYNRKYNYRKTVGVKNSDNPNRDVNRDFNFIEKTERHSGGWETKEICFNW